MKLISLKSKIYPTLLALSISNIRGNPCVMSSSVYSSSWMDLNSFSRHWMRGRLCCWKDVRKDSSHVCSVQGTPMDRGQSSFPALEKKVPFCFFTFTYAKILSKSCQITLEIKFLLFPWLRRLVAIRTSQTYCTEAFLQILGEDCGLSAHLALSFSAETANLW